MTSTPKNAGSVTDGAFLNKTYEEALALVDRTVRYIEQEAPHQKKTLSTADLARTTVLSMRHSTELMQIMAWLLLHKAVKAGEMTLAEALAPKNLLGKRQAEVPTPESLSGVPETLKELMVEGTALYERVVRLEHMLLDETAEHPLHRLSRDLER